MGHEYRDEPDGGGDERYRATCETLVGCGS
jgi:hypothetical protein